jgi:hypothetical protein
VNFHHRLAIRQLTGLFVWFVLAVPFTQGFLALAQQAQPERTYPYLKTNVEQTLRTLGAYSSGQLPILEGFVVEDNDSLDRYQRPYYQYSVQVVALPSGKTLVRAVAKITAWYSGPDASRSGYRELTSNGRLENDLFARLDDALKASGPGFVTDSKSRGAIDRPLPKVGGPSPELRDPTPPPIKPETSSSSATERRSQPAAAPNTPPTDAVDLESLRKQTEALEKRRNELSTTVHDLEDVLRNQAHPTDLAVVGKSGTPVFAQPENTARVLFRAEAEDEFEVLDLQRDWAHVQISGASRGWIRRSQIDLPDGRTGPPAPAANNAAAADTRSVRAAREPFHVTREETVTFAGNWEPLKGKTVKLVWVQPASLDEKPTGPSAKLLYARTVFLKLATELAQSSANIAGVVIVFDSADGGQAATPLSLLLRWKSGTVSDAEFWKQVSLDPPETFREPKS